MLKRLETGPNSHSHMFAFFAEPSQVFRIQFSTAV